MQHCPNTFVYSVSLPFPTFEGPQRFPLDSAARLKIAALRRCTTAWMITTPQTVSANELFCSIAQYFLSSSRQADKLLAQNTNPPGAQKFRSIHECHLKSGLHLLSQFPNRNLRVPRINSSI